jgi:hypothetical protein
MNGKLPLIRGALALFFWPRYARRKSQEHHQYLNSASAAPEPENQEPWAEKQVSILRSAWLRALLVVIVVMAVGMATGHLLDALAGQDRWWQATMQYIGAGLLLWVTLAAGGFSIQTMDGETFAEVLDASVHRIIHVVGTFLFVAGTAWSMIGTT